MIKKLTWISAILVLLLGSGILAATQLVETRYNKVRTPPPYSVKSELHQSLFIADLHADSLLWGRDLLKRSTIGHVDLPRLQEANVSLQVFTVVTTAPRRLNVNQNSSETVRTLTSSGRWPSPSTGRQTLGTAPNNARCTRQLASTNSKRNRMALS
ncbi:Zn-dependent dipeptidase [Candidatus Koribacter versatilis Ellin345]|uniref:Zn-dependent dipeptidase n=1 Tax=Koribacter versatilis (strain Ellin345) TaxID=204669 RepID=Q1IJB1_KORVE|nr:Zn-dependent dipeptidase [Candidatus Koribacter versatilis]ABF43039.1 Zn-dependent dipeptidase [Candidatus Koribacter versatilis Ellin345]